MLYEVITVSQKIVEIVFGEKDILTSKISEIIENRKSLLISLISLKDKYKEIEEVYDSKTNLRIWAPRWSKRLPPKLVTWPVTVPQLLPSWPRPSTQKAPSWLLRRITSYNVCYTKLLRMCKSSIGTPLLSFARLRH